MAVPTAAPPRASRSISSTCPREPSTACSTPTERLAEAWSPILLALCIIGSLGCVCIWPVLLVGSMLPVVSFIALPALLVTSFSLFHLLPATLRLALAEPQPRLFPPFHLVHPLQNSRLWVSCTRTALDLHGSNLLTHFLEDLTKKVLLLRNSGSNEADPTCRTNIVFVPADVDTGRPAKRLDVYLTEENDTAGDDKENIPLAQVIILLAFPSYRLAGSRSFPASAIAAQLRSTLDVCVVVPSLTPFRNGETEGEALERMVGETRECIRWVGENIARYGGDSEQIWLMGFGAGAHIASLAMVQSAVVAAREGYFSQRMTREATCARKEGLISVDDGGSSSVLDPLSPQLPESGARSSETAPGAAMKNVTEAATSVGPPPSPIRRRQRTTSSDLAGTSPSMSFERSRSSREDYQAEDDDEVERLLRQSRLARLEKLEAEEAPATWSEPRREVEQATASGIAVPFPTDASSALVGRGNESDEEDQAECDFELSISDGVRSSRLFTLGSIEPARRTAQQYAQIRTSRVREDEDEELFVADPTLYRHEPEFGFTSGQSCASLASFELPSRESTRRKKRREPTKRVEVQGMILVEGTYDIVKQAKWEAEHGIEQISSLTRLCEDSHRDFLHACPSHLLYAASPLLSALDSTSPASDPRRETGPPVSRRLLPPKVLLIHGGADHLSPFSPAVLFRNLLVGVGLESDEVKVKLYRHLTGFGAFSALMGHGAYASILYDEIAEVLELDEEDTEDGEEYGQGDKGKGKAAQQQWL